ncbi:MAG: hypothetical protein KZQ83_06325 [gamma proteobacterium symbiont of Taylorina sp.]|nr:hypothetical protein [gamma proteobacterium symbiont of Taylorina sp.]
MNLASKAVILDTGLSILFTLIGGGNFYSFLFFFVLLFIPAISIFVSFDTMAKKSANKTKQDTE